MEDLRAEEEGIGIVTGEKCMHEVGVCRKG